MCLELLEQWASGRKLMIWVKAGKCGFARNTVVLDLIRGFFV